MAKGKARIMADGERRGIDIKITFDPKGKYAENTGVLPQVTGDIYDAVRKHFFVPHIVVSQYVEAARRPKAKKK